LASLPEVVSAIDFGDGGQRPCGPVDELAKRFSDAVQMDVLGASVLE